MLARFVSPGALVVWGLLAAFGWFAIAPGRISTFVAMIAGLALVIALLILILVRASKR